MSDDEDSTQLTWRAMVRLPTEQGEWIEARARRLGLRPGEVLRMILMDRWHDEHSKQIKEPHEEVR